MVAPATQISSTESSKFEDPHGSFGIGIILVYFELIPCIKCEDLWVAESN